MNGEARTDACLGTPEGTNPEDILILEFWSLELKESAFLGAICYSTSNKLTQVLALTEPESLSHSAWATLNKLLYPGCLKQQTRTPLDSGTWESELQAGPRLRV